MSRTKKMCRQNGMCVGMKKKTPKIPSGILTLKLGWNYWGVLNIYNEVWGIKTCLNKMTIRLSKKIQCKVK